VEEELGGCGSTAVARRLWLDGCGSTASRGHSLFAAASMTQEEAMCVSMRMGSVVSQGA